ncbi:hypothetical protein ACVBEQ_10600 [Nakamurella sp. GG22]
MVQPIVAERSAPMGGAGGRGTATAARPGSRPPAPAPARQSVQPQVARPQTVHPRPSGPPPISQPQPPARSASRRTGLSILLAVLVLLLAALVLFAVDHLVGQMSAGLLEGWSAAAGTNAPSVLR